MISGKIEEKALHHVRRYFATHIPAKLKFHDLEHTLDVTRVARQLGHASGLTERELSVLVVSALFHDLGYAHAYRGHEEESARLAARFLEGEGATGREIHRVRGIIRATRLGVEPRSLLQRIMCDADSSKAGQSDFQEKGQRLRKELDLVLGIRYSDAEWDQENLSYLQGHTFYTKAASHHYGEQKIMNLKAIEEQVRSRDRPGAERLHTADQFFDRDLSWLSFNDRVLQEAKDRENPLFERVKFLAIYSNNLDEFFRVRVASLRGLSQLGDRTRQALGLGRSDLIERIKAKTLAQQQEFGALWRGELLPLLREEGVRILGPEDLNKRQRKHLDRYVSLEVIPMIGTATVKSGNAPFIEDRKLYLCAQVRSRNKSKTSLVLVSIPSDTLGRFVVLPSGKGRTDILFLDDAVRSAVPKLLKGREVLSMHAIKLSRDADLSLEEEFGERVVDRVRKSLRKRKTGLPARFLYDQDMPGKVLSRLQELLGLSTEDLVAGGRYHNFSDLFTLPLPDRPDLRFPERAPQRHPTLSSSKDLFASLGKQDALLHFPYHDFREVVRLLNDAAKDPDVTAIRITLYRVAERSKICRALIDALKRGKRVTAFVEVQARFDERSNLYWGAELEQAGAEVLYSYAGLKVHCKLCLIERMEGGRTKRYAYLGTGNFNENTARIYTDSALLTADKVLTREVAEVFRYLSDRTHLPKLSHCLMAPLHLRTALDQAIDREIEQARRGKEAQILLKVNSLEDKALIRKLYEASRMGVKVRIIVRGICCLVPGVPGMSEHIRVMSIVGRYLEHVRAYVFHNKGRERVYLSSADWMERNLDRRVEVAFPILDPTLREEVLLMLRTQWKDRRKARRIDVKQTNPYWRKGKRSKTATDAQERFRELLVSGARQRPKKGSG
ncbi:MAG: polyphosphate kinase 1 [Flavobacteriales bacterium]|nr:polyphosphate kinase 1 [Flavobacteriales bacterium]